MAFVQLKRIKAHRQTKINSRQEIKIGLMELELDKVKVVRKMLAIKYSLKSRLKDLKVTIKRMMEEIKILQKVKEKVRKKMGLIWNRIFSINKKSNYNSNKETNYGKIKLMNKKEKQGTSYLIISYGMISIHLAKMKVTNKMIKINNRSLLIYKIALRQEVKMNCKQMMKKIKRKRIQEKIRRKKIKIKIQMTQRTQKNKTFKTKKINKSHQIKCKSYQARRKNVKLRNKINKLKNHFLNKMQIVKDKIKNLGLEMIQSEKIKIIIAIKVKTKKTIASISMIYKTFKTQTKTVMKMIPNKIIRRNHK